MYASKKNEMPLLNENDRWRQSPPLPSQSDAGLKQNDRWKRTPNNSPKKGTYRPPHLRTKQLDRFKCLLEEDSPPRDEFRKPPKQMNSRWKMSPTNTENTFRKKSRFGGNRRRTNFKNYSSRRPYQKMKPVAPDIKSEEMFPTLGGGGKKKAPSPGRMNYRVKAQKDEDIYFKPLRKEEEKPKKKKVKSDDGTSDYICLSEQEEEYDSDNYNEDYRIMVNDGRSNASLRHKNIMAPRKFE